MEHNTKLAPKLAKELNTFYAWQVTSDDYEEEGRRAIAKFEQQLGGIFSVVAVPGDIPKFPIPLPNGCIILERKTSNEIR